MSKLIPKFVKQLDPDYSYILHIKGDWGNDNYISEDTHWGIGDDLNQLLPYLSILVDLFKYDSEYRDYQIDISENLIGAFERYLYFNNGFCQELWTLRYEGNGISERLSALSGDEFKNIYDSTIAELKDTLIDIRYDYFPASAGGYNIHTLKEMYIEHQGNRFEVQAGKAVEALAELMDRLANNLAQA